MQQGPPASPPTLSPRARHLLAAALLLTLMFGLALGSALSKTPVATEPAHMARGWAFWRTGDLLPTATLPLADLLFGLGGLLEPTLPAPHTLDGWAAGDAAALGRALLWGSGADTARAVLLFRLPAIWLGLLLGALVWRWAADLYGRWGGTVALIITALSPNVLAFAGLATPDLPRALFFTAALFAWSRYLRRQTLGGLLLAAVVFGLALAGAFSSLLLIPVLIFTATWQAGRHDPLRLRGAGALSRLFDRLGGMPLGWLWSAVAVLSLTAAVSLLVTGGSLAAMHGQLDALTPYVATGQRALAGGQSDLVPYMLGRFSETGWFYDTFVILGLKLPLAALVLLAVALILTVARRPHEREWDLILAALFFFAASLVDPFGPELRYLLPLLVLITVFSARVAAGSSELPWLRPALALVLVLNYAATHLLVYPDYLAYFNIAAGGQDDAATLLVGSNSDWGQDIGALAAYLERRGAGPVYLSVYGEAPPEAYGIEALPLPGGAEGSFAPLNPAPGLYAISATHLVGAPRDLTNDVFGAFQLRDPVAQIGGSIYVYEVASAVQQRAGNNAPWLAQCVDATDPDLGALTGLPSLQTYTFDCESSLALPTGPGWVVFPAGVTPVVDLGDPDSLLREPDGSPRAYVWRVDAPPAAPTAMIAFPPVALPVPIAGYLELLGYDLSTRIPAPGDELTLTTWWRIRELPAPPVTFFARITTPDEREIVAADALGIPAESWQPGMIIVQQHVFEIPPETPPGSYAVIAGLGSPETGFRYPVFESGDRVVDHIVLRGIEVRP